MAKNEASIQIARPSKISEPLFKTFARRNETPDTGGGGKSPQG